MALVVLAAVVYNAILAVINAHVRDLSLTSVAATELLIMFAAVLIILKKGIYEEDLAPLFYLLITLFLTVYVSVINHLLIIDYFRNVLVIFCFVTLGTWTNDRTVKFIFMTASILVFAFLVMEIFLLDQYADFFYPAKYFENTRGIAQFEIGNSKLFRNALGFEGRFSFGIIDHRSSSLFLEQVSLANFSGVMMIYLVSLWGRFSPRERAFCILTIVLILVTNDTRTMMIFSVISFIGYFLFPHVPRILGFLVMPAFLAMGFAVYALKPDATGDNIPGRVVTTMKNFADVDLLTLLGFSAERASSFADSGYIYVVVIGTIFSFLFLWLFVTLYPACDHPDERRFAHSLSVFIFMNMMIGGTAIFSIKIAGLLWLLAGHLKFSRRGRIAADARLEPVSVR
ncbi:hypothetical protein HK439_22060 [Labrenzia aggregata]|uniref:Polymerase n=1 Tax=Roseibium aggregatum TaxID=187304 RepID=A0A926P443_9HYPH|nr:hypothetical protein [Roseibium aggregatum]